MEVFNIKVNPTNLVRDVVISIQNNTFEDPSEASAFFEKCKEMILVDKKPLSAVKECIARTPEILATQDFDFASGAYSALLAYMNASCPPQVKPKFLANIVSEVAKNSVTDSFTLAVLTHIYALFYAEAELKKVVFCEGIIPLLKKSQEAGVSLRNFIELSADEIESLNKICPEKYSEFLKI